MERVTCYWPEVNPYYNSAGHKLTPT